MNTAWTIGMDVVAIVVLANHDSGTRQQASDKQVA